MNETQLTTLRTAILADLIAGPSYAAGADNDVLARMKTLTSPAVKAWDTNALVSDLFDAVDRSKYTPTDVADSTVLYTNRCLACQTKLMALDGMLVGRSNLNMAKANIRKGLQDACIQIPSGVSGAPAASSGAAAVTILTAGTRVMNLTENALTTGTAQTGTVTAALMGFEGEMTQTDLNQMRILP